MNDERTLIDLASSKGYWINYARRERGMWTVSVSRSRGAGPSQMLEGDWEHVVQMLKALPKARGKAGKS